jgi:hypothetical protein
MVGLDIGRKADKRLTAGHVGMLGGVIHYAGRQVFTL